MPVADAARDASRLPVLTGVQPQQVPAFWPIVAPYIARKTARYPNKPDLDAIYRDLVAGGRQLWIASSRERDGEGVLLTQIIVTDQGPVCALRLVVGKEPERWIHFLRTIEEWAASCGCCRMTTEWTRPSWRKLLPGYVLKQTRPDGCIWMDKELTI